MKKLLILLLLFYPTPVNSSALTKWVTPAPRHQERAVSYQLWRGGKWGKPKPYSGGSIKVTGSLAYARHVKSKWVYRIKLRINYPGWKWDASGCWEVKSLNLA